MEEQFSIQRAEGFRQSHRLRPRSRCSYWRSPTVLLLGRYRVCSDKVPFGLPGELIEIHCDVSEYIDVQSQSPVICIDAFHWSALSLHAAASFCVRPCEGLELADLEQSVSEDNGLDRSFSFPRRTSSGIPGVCVVSLGYRR